MSGDPLFAPRTFDRAVYLVGAVLWPYPIPFMVKYGEYLVAFILTVWTLIAWIHTVRWIAGCIRGRVF